MSDSLKAQYASTPLFGANATAIEAFYEQFLADPDSVPTAWRDYFDTLGSPDTEIAHSTIREELRVHVRFAQAEIVELQDTGNRPIHQAEWVDISYLVAAQTVDLDKA